MKRESTDLNSSNEFHYIRPKATEVMMAKEDPLRPYCTSKQEHMDGGAYSTMVLWRKPDAPLEVEKKILVLSISMLNCIFIFHSKSSEGIILYAVSESISSDFLDGKCQKGSTIVKISFKVLILCTVTHNKA